MPSTPLIGSRLPAPGLRPFLATVIALLLGLALASPAQAAQKTFRDEVDPTGTIDLRTITLETTRTKLKVDLKMQEKIKRSLLRDNQAGISMEFLVDDESNILRVAFVVKVDGTVVLEVCDGFDGCVERKGEIDGRHARFKLPLKRVQDGRKIFFRAFTFVAAGANQCPELSSGCIDEYPDSGFFDTWRVPR